MFERLDPKDAIGVSKHVGTVNDVVDATADVGAEAIDRATHVIGNGLKFMGIAASANELVDEMRRRDLIKPETLKWFTNMPYAASMRALLVVAATLSVGPATPDKLAKSLQTAQGIHTMATKQRATEHIKWEAAQNPQERLQHFLDSIRGPVSKLREKYADTGDTVKDQAWRIALSNVFTPYENRITAEGLNKDPEFVGKLTEVLGAPPTLADMFKSNDVLAYKEHYPEFKQQIFEIYKDPEFGHLQHQVWDSRLFFYYEVLDRANSDQPDFEKYRNENKELIAEAINYFKKGNNLEAVMHFMDTDEWIREDKMGQHVPLDIPEKLQG